MVVLTRRFDQHPSDSPAEHGYERFVIGRRESLQPEVIRGPGHTGCDLVTVQVQQIGCLELFQGGQVTPVPAGHLLIFDASHPFVLTYPGPHLSSRFETPKRRLGLSDADLAALCRAPLGLAATDAPGGGASVAAAAITQLARVAGTLSARAGALMAEVIVDLVRIAATEQLAVYPSSDLRHRGVVQQVSDYIDAHLRDADLAPAAIAAARCMSLRALHKAFENEPATVHRLIQQRRLEHARTDLGAPGEPPIPVAAIAERWGFGSASLFTRLFRQRFGASPSEWRRARRDSLDIWGPDSAPRGG
ncbi:AraC family transcriptional regulator [Cryobacterium melibiosiphilum]|uniref:AraC family transcriptional regulator n=1 Tax=Cryobacterium melibiosiphilum TaxID=995039 RepID=A0A3A5MKD9_9MICO|nr:AraC family transcriptional regulator [Cryobacterium melibiosiphilum]RJT88639.1 AraC family transcriptional regulator [Cryobacterium melibiosiphilum]RJT89401.1 AraC family transcriptional regulator [Cryobacterium melibiosiphilum]